MGDSHTDNQRAHHGFQCDGCGLLPIMGIRFKCERCDDFDFCKACHDDPSAHHDRGHTFKAIAPPVIPSGYVVNDSISLRTDSKLSNGIELKAGLPGRVVSGSQDGDTVVFVRFDGVIDPVCVQWWRLRLRPRPCLSKYTMVPSMLEARCWPRTENAMFVEGEGVVWIEKRDPDVPPDTHGIIVGFLNDRAYVSFPLGTWGFETAQLRPTKGVPKEGIDAEGAELGLSDGHLLYGMTRSAILQFAARIGFPTQYDRVTTLRKLGEKNWLDPIYGTERTTGYDFCYAIRAWLLDRPAPECDLSVAEIYMRNGWAGVGRAKAFLSHVQSESLETTLSNGLVQDGEEMWLDYVTLRQRGNDFNAGHIAKVVARIANTKAVEDDDMQYFNRAFCILELAVTPEHCLSLNYCTSRAELESMAGTCFGNITLCGDHVRMGANTIRQTATIGTLCTSELLGWAEEARGQVLVRSKDATCRKQHDLDEVRTFIEANGGFAEIDARVNRALRFADADANHA